MENKELFELTNPQKNIWNTEQFYNGSNIENLVGTLIIDEPVNFDLLKMAINISIKNNDGLRLKIFLSQNSVKQYVSSYNPIDFKIIELHNIDSLKDVETNIVNTPFSILDNNLFEFTIFKFDNGHGGIIAKLHHIISDAWTMTLLTDQIINNYSNLLHNKTIENTSYSYIDFISSEKKYLQSPKFNKSMDFWNSEFDTLSFSYITESDSNSCRAKRLSYTLDKDFCMKISNFCEKYKTSPYSIFMSSLSIYLAKINNTNDSIIGTPILNRTNFKEKNTMGMFISTIPFKAHIEPLNTYISFLEDFSNKEFSFFRNQKYPYNILLNDLRKKFNISKNLYDVSLSYQNARNNTLTSDVKYHTEWVFNNTVSDNLDIHIYDTNNTGLLSLSYDYKVELFKEIDIILLHKRLIALITQILDNPNILIKDLKILSEEEENYIFKIYNNTTDCSYLNNIPFIALFEEQVKNGPNNLAVCDENLSYTYKELDNLSNNLANILLEKGVKKGDRLCLFFKNSVEFIISILATLKIGACCIPIDVKNPIDRIKYILENSCSRLVLSNSTNMNLLSDFDTEKMLVSLNDLDINYEKNIDISKITSTDLAYIIYTSGSTGNPKGVAISNKSLSNYINFCKKQYVANEKTNFPLYSSIAFDLTVTSIYTPLTTGNTIYVYKNENPQLLLKSIIDDKKVHIIKLTPAHLSLLADIDCSQSIVSKLIVGGDILPVDICKKISSKFKNIHIYNEYGPTEATVGCMIYEYSEKDNVYTSVPIGKPINNVNIYLLDKYLSPVPCGSLGEIYIEGDCLSVGYIGLDNINKKSFIKSPFNNNSILYKTGDLAKLYYNDTMEYWGRSDFQVKINGFRIEMGEIQSNLLKHGDINDCYVTVLNIDDKKILCAYYISDKDIPNLDSFLSDSLPVYMIPKHFIRLKEFPLTINGKVNRSLLPLPELKIQSYEAPTNDLEVLLQSIFMQLLSTDSKISVTANIFEYYIDSLILIKAQTMLYSNGININTQIFYEYKTIRDLSNYILNHVDSDFCKDNTYPNISEITTSIENTYSYNNILMFGVTGFLGIHILYNLLKTTTSEIYCIIREKANISPYERLKNKFLFYFSNDIFLKYEKRIHIIDGNLLQDRFGLSLNEYNNLSKTIDLVIDTAAIVKHYGNYDSFFETNVNGTKRIIDFCKISNIPFHYISTLSVSGYGLVSTPLNATFDETNLYIGQKYKDNVYVRSKFEAEKLILNECKNGLIASIYRIGNITNRFSDGIFQENLKENAFLNRLVGFISLGMIPNEMLNFSFEFTPVDICANFIVSLLNCQDKNLKIYHLFNPNFVTGKVLVDFINTTIYKIKCVSFEEFKNTLISSNKQYFGITNYLNNINGESNVIIKNDITTLDLQKKNLSWPKVDASYMNKIITYINKNNLIGGNTNEK